MSSQTHPIVLPAPAIDDTYCFWRSKGGPFQSLHLAMYQRKGHCTRTTAMLDFLSLLLLYTYLQHYFAASIHYFALQHPHTFVYAAPLSIRLFDTLTSPIKSYHDYGLHQMHRLAGFFSISSCFSAAPVIDSCTNNKISYTPSNGKPECSRRQPSRRYSKILRNCALHPCTDGR